jgi:hypothetical protein
MSYDTSLENSSTYQFADNYNGSLVNANPDYHTLKNYYSQPRCPYRNDVGECLVRPIYITPAFGGTGYKIPGFNANTNPNLPLSDSNYFNINQAYPQYCKTPCLQPTYQ